MELKDLYQTIVSRTPVDVRQLRERNRIAAVKPGELDIMKIAAVGYVTVADYETGDLSIFEGRAHIAVAKVCPGLAAVTMTSEGDVRLSALERTLDIVTPIRLHLSQNPFDLDYPGCTWEEGQEELGPLRGYRNAHWVPLGSYPVVRVTKGELKQLSDIAFQSSV